MTNPRSDRSSAAFKAAVLACCVVAVPAPAPPDDDDDGSFGFTTPVVCSEINGYDDFVPLPGARLTSDDKLLVYFKPRHYKSELVKDKFVAHLTQDARLRRKGEKAALQSKKNVLDYKVGTDTPPRNIYLRNSWSLKGLKPGGYEFEITLRDEVGRGAPAVRSVPFEVVAPKAAGEAGTP